ncbi:MAG: hypothetical protein IPP60_11880 [Sphingobacteriales bacterium]|nr:hypothetical protein [Sphingobacteriales bacterium]
MLIIYPSWIYRTAYLDVLIWSEMNKQYFLNESIKATKVFYTKDNVRMLILEPVYKDAQKDASF